MIPIKFSRKQFEELYPNDEACLQKLFLLKYGNAKKCAKCDKPFKYHKLKNLRLYSCQFCGWNIAPTANTIFHKSPTPLTDWFYVIYLFSISKNGLSAKEIERHLGLTYKCAWRIANRVRMLFDATVNTSGSGSNTSGGSSKDTLKNTVEIDETYWGGVSKGLKAKEYKDRGSRYKRSSKKSVFGMVERGGNIKAKVVINARRKTVMPLIRKNIEIGTEIMSDQYQVYRVLAEQGYLHQTVNHKREEWVRGKVHTNTIEGFWSQLKRSLNGTYHMVSPKYLQSYVNEFSWRYNQRKNPVPAFYLLSDSLGRKV